MNAFEFAIARKLHQLKLQPPPLTKEDLILLATCEWAVNGFETWRALHAADAKRLRLRKASAIRVSRYQVVGEESG
jgi:hypothetical protein